MNNEMTLSANQERMDIVMHQAAETLRWPLASLANYYSRIMERHINIRQTLWLLNAQLAFVAAVFTSCSPLTRMLFVAWLAAALLKCKKEL